MLITKISKAEALFAASKKKEKQFLEDKESARKEEAATIKRLRNLRLAKEALDKEAARKIEAEKAAAKVKKSKR